MALTAVVVAIVQVLAAVAEARAASGARPHPTVRARRPGFFPASLVLLLQALAQPADLNLPVPQALLPPSHLHLTPLDFLLTATKSLLLAVRILALIALLDHVPNGLQYGLHLGLRAGDVGGAGHA